MARPGLSSALQRKISEETPEETLRETPVTNNFGYAATGLQSPPYNQLSDEAKDMHGKRFYCWVVTGKKPAVLIKSQSNGQEYDSWMCKCDCGSIKVVSGSNLRGHKSKSCGCQLWKRRTPKDFKRSIESVKEKEHDFSI